MMTPQMQTIRVHGYGEPGRLEMIDAPQAMANEVIVRVYAAGVNPIDSKLIGGAMRAFRPLAFPHIPGLDIAGVIEEVGPGVSAFQQTRLSRLPTTSISYLTPWVRRRWTARLRC